MARPCDVACAGRRGARRRRLSREPNTDLTPTEVADLASLNLALVGLAGFEDYFPAQISGGMQKRTGLARAMALSPEVLLFDEPSAGLDPISSRLLDDLILELRDSLGATIVMVTHELASIFAVGDNSFFFDPETETQIASGAPARSLAECRPPKRSSAGGSAPRNSAICGRHQVSY